MIWSGLCGISEVDTYVGDAVMRGEENEGGHSAPEGIVVEVGVATVRVVDSGSATVADGACGEGENSNEDKRDGDMERWVDV